MATPANNNPLALRPYYAGIVTLTGTAQSILALIQSVYTAGNNEQVPPNMTCAQLNLKADSGNSTNNCLIGDEKVSTSRYGNQLTSAAADRALVYGPFTMNTIELSNIYAIASAGSPKLMIEVIQC
jgi:hypothetical protein